MPQAYKKLIRFIKMKTFERNSEIKFGLIYSKLNKDKERLREIKIKKYLSQLNSKEEAKQEEQFGHFSINRRESFDSISTFVEDL